MNKTCKYAHFVFKLKIGNGKKVCIIYASLIHVCVYTCGIRSGFTAEWCLDPFTHQNYDYILFLKEDKKAQTSSSNHSETLLLLCL